MFYVLKPHFAPFLLEKNVLLLYLIHFGLKLARIIVRLDHSMLLNNITDAITHTHTYTHIHTHTHTHTHSHSHTQIHTHT